MCYIYMAVRCCYTAEFCPFLIVFLPMRCIPIIVCNRNNVLRPSTAFVAVSLHFLSGDRRSWRIGALSAAAPPGLRCFASSESLKTSRRNQPSMHWIWRGTINYRRWRKRRRNLWLGKMNVELRAKYIAIEMMDYYKPTCRKIWRVLSQNELSAIFDIFKVRPKKNCCVGVTGYWKIG